MKGKHTEAATPMSTQQSRLSFIRLERYQSRQFREAMHIYLAEFSRDSRLSISRIRELLKAKDYQLILAEEDGKVVGIALIWISRIPVFVHLDYIAVEQSRKGKGIGTALYRWLLTRLSDLSPQARLLTLEVEDDLIPFYQRSQTRLLRNVSYLFPGPLGPVPMHLMVHDLRGRTELDRRTVQGVIRALYCGLHEREPTDPLLRECWTQVPDKASLT